MDTKTLFEAVVEKCGDQNMTAGERNNLYAYFLHGIDAYKSAWESARKSAAKEILDHLGSAKFWADGPDTNVVSAEFIKEYITSTFDVEI